MVSQYAPYHTMRTFSCHRQTPSLALCLRPYCSLIPAHTLRKRQLPGRHAQIFHIALYHDESTIVASLLDALEVGR